jgi:16S rRNA (guanine966-N2)-methyltransferase
MADRVRGGLFNVLGDISGLTVVDAFAGSGALGFEALSRGAESVLAIESDRSAQRAIRENAAMLGLEKSYKPVASTVAGWLSTSDDEHRFDLILADPPYDDLQLSTIISLAARLKPTGTFVLSWPGRNAAPIFEGMEIAKQKSYGDAQLIYYTPVISS